MKVLFISPDSPFQSIGGVERYVLNLINFFKVQKDIKTFLILPTIEESHKVKDGNMTIYYDKNFFIPRTKESAVIKHKNEQGFSDLVESIIKNEGIDVICAENILFGTRAGFSFRLNMLATLYKIPLLLRLHVYPQTPLQIAMVKELMWDHISCVSRSVAGDCFQKGTDIKKLSTDYLGVNTLDFKPDAKDNNTLKKDLGLSEKTKIILTAGRIITGPKNMLKEKGMINLIEAFSRISPQFPDMRLVIGVARAKDNLKEYFDNAYEMLEGYIKINHVTDKTIVKMFELDEMPRVYRGSDVLILTAERNETLGQIFIEAMACGLPVIGAKTGGIPEIIRDNHSGYLVLPNDPIVLAQKIEKILTDKIIRDKFIKNGHETVEDKFTAKKQFSDFHDLLKTVVVEYKKNL